MKSFAGFWQRGRAFLFDYLVILGYLIVLTLLFSLVNRFTNGVKLLFASRIQAQVSVFLSVTLPVILYFAIGESSVRQGSWGKQRLGLKVSDRDGKRIGFLRAFIRGVLKFIPWEFSHYLIWQIYFSTAEVSAFTNYGFILVYSLIGLNIASVIMTKTKQSLYDRIARTYVHTL